MGTLNIKIQCILFLVSPNTTVWRTTKDSARDNFSMSDFFVWQQNKVRETCLLIEYSIALLQYREVKILSSMWNSPTDC